jgi:hypothetical protein
VAFLLQFFLQLEIVFDNPIVDDDDLSGAVAMRVGVFFSGAAVGRPTRVADTVGAIQRGLGDNLLEIAKFARGAANLQFAVPGYGGDARGIIAAVLKLPQAFDDDGDNFFGPDIADYSAHVRGLLERVSSSVAC